MHGFAHVKKFARLLLSCYAGFLDEIDIRLRASVSDWRLVCVHFHNGVVYAHCRECGQYMLDCVDSHRAFADRRGALDSLQVLDFRVNRWLILQIFSLKFNSVIHRRGMQSERNFFTGVQRSAGKTGNLANSLLKFRRRGHL
ncbi:MAG: hypothetical protein Udaeo_02820 [Candidatus Udaeobacter sp.]|nr:MAG: hypothetical protein Udaeo_02820 [Candidatus Udaeobacter sp.]